MILSRLCVSGIRNIDRIQIDAHRKLNWITGLNGAGKTSLLEAIFFIARGRSFRGKKHGQLIGRGRQHFEIAADLEHEDGLHPKSSISVIQTKSEMRCLENGLPLVSLKKSRNRLHVRMIADNAQHLLEGHPQIRRLFLDWNLFHVEHGYALTLSDFRRVLNQRNAWLRSGAPGPPIWDEPFCRLASSMTSARVSLVESLQESLDAAADASSQLLPRFRIKYRLGWPQDRPLSDVLHEYRMEDAARGYTFFGPSRADFSVLSEKLDALPSRGQTKLLVFHLQLGAQQFSDNRGGARPVWLLDDLSSELDARAVASILDRIGSSGCQAFITAISDRSSAPPIDHVPRGTMFHVEHGRLVCCA